MQFTPITSLHSVTPLSPNLLMRLNCALFILTCLLVTQCYSYDCSSPSDTLCQDCYSPPACTACIAGYYVDSTDQSCRPCGATHPPACSACTETGCTQCPVGYYPLNPCNSTVYSRPSNVRTMYRQSGILPVMQFGIELRFLPTLNHSE